MKKLLVLALLLTGCAGTLPQPIEHTQPMVQSGLEALVASDFKTFAGKRVGLITNHTAITRKGRHVADLLHAAPNVKLVALFGPEHGVRGMTPGGRAVTSNTDPATGVPVHSLYGKTRRPTKEMLDNVDVLVFDIQDVGARFYTYVSTMALAMQSAAEHSKKFVVLDRPNPICGRVEGPTLEKGHESFVGLYPIPVRHGLTVGEMARLIKGEKWFEGADTLDLDVVPAEGWRRWMWYDDTKLPWIAPSPNMKTLATATVYPGTCLFEGTNVSEGRGTKKPFEWIGAPWIDAGRLAQALNRLKLPGVTFEPIEFTPRADPPSVPRPKHRNKKCHGVFIKIVRRADFEPVRTGVAILWTLRQHHPEKFRWRGNVARLYGSDRLREAVDAATPLVVLTRHYLADAVKFASLTEKYRLYK